MLLEVSIAAHTPNVYKIVFKEVLTLLLCLTSYNQLFFSICLILTLAYNIARYYQFEDDLYVYCVFVASQILFTGVCLFVSRVYMFKERQAYNSYTGQKQLISVFHNIMKVFHDGIVVAQKETILYHNEQSLKLFGMDLTNEDILINKGNNDVESGKSLSELIEYNPEAIPNFII